MALPRLIQLFFLYSCVNIILAEDVCIVYDFNNDVDSLIGAEKSICASIPGAWSAGNYSEIGVESPNDKSETFMYTGSTMSCASSFDFTMAAGGLIEVNVYVEEGAALNQITVLALQINGDANDPVVGTAFIHPGFGDFVSGWNNLRFTVVGMGTFIGYLTFMGIGSDDSLVLIDSFRYIPAGVDENSCVIYEEDIATTTEKQVDTTEADEKENCVTYNFEADFDIRFTTNNYLCEGFLPWHLDNYTSIDIESPSPESTVFMTPNEFSSCISSFVFKMAPGGIVEANVYMEPVSVLDHIVILAQRVTDMEYDTVAGFRMYHPEKHLFVNGWNVLRFSLLDSSSFEGYLIFIGSAEKDSTVLVDSVRYIPPEITTEDDSCILY